MRNIHDVIGGYESTPTLEPTITTSDGLAVLQVAGVSEHHPATGVNKDTFHRECVPYNVLSWSRDDMPSDD